MAAQLYKTASGRLFHAGAVAIVTVGLPARGKTHVSRSLCRYLRWLGVSTRVFSVGNYRRERMGSIPNEWFDPSNTEAIKVREKIAEECLDDMIEWLWNGGGQVGIYDGNNVTESRRREIYDKLIANDIHPLFIESICTKQDIVLANIRSVKISSPDYVGWDPEEAVKDYTHRIEQLMQHYETIADTKLPFVKLLDVGEKIIVNNVAGYLHSRIVYYLMNLHIQPRKIYFARTGRAPSDATYKSDTELTEEGLEYAQTLKNFVLAYRAQQIASSDEQERPLTVWTSTRKKARQTAKPFEDAGIPVRLHSVLVQLNPGEADNLTPEQLKEKFPEEVARARQDPYRHRYPRAESYHDLAVRLESIIMELERERNDVLIIGHETVLKCLYAYLFDRPEIDIPTISIPRNFLIEITPSAYGCKEDVFMQNWAAGRVADTLEFSTETYGVGFRRAAAMEGGGNPHGLSDSEWKYYQYAKSQPNGLKFNEVPPGMEKGEAMETMNLLLKKNAIELVSLNGENMVRVIDLSQAERASKLTDEARLVYNAIRAAGNEGIWTRELKKKTGLHTIVLNRTLKLLEQKQEIKSVKHVKFPTRKIYMLFDITPSSEVTGGAWYTDQELDTEFIDSLKTACLKYITGRSFPRVENVRDAVFGADHEHYPTAADVRKFITDSRISSVDLSIKDITSLLENLVYDGLIEKRMPFFGGGLDDELSDDEKNDDQVPWAYKAVRRTTSRLPTEALTETPCGKCPVFNFCTEDGPVNPGNCEYYKTWLEY